MNYIHLYVVQGSLQKHITNLTKMPTVVFFSYNYVCGIFPSGGYSETDTFIHG